MMFKLLLGIFLCFIFSQGEEKKNDFDEMLNKLLDHSVPEISVDDVLKLKDSVLFLDARHIDEYEVSHISGAVHGGYKSFRIGSLKSVPKDKKIIVYCSVGYRSEKVAEKILKAGYKDVSNLYGGIFQWVNMGNKVYKDSLVTTKVHAYNKKWGKWLQSGEKVFK